MRFVLKYVFGMNKNNLNKIIEYFEKRYPNPRPALEYGSNYQLLVAVILSAQCTDERVNKVTKVLFEKFPTPSDIIKLSVSELEKYIFSCGLYHSKAEHILQATADIINIHGGEVPSDYEKLLTLSGVGRKTANVMWAVAFNQPAIAVDTHVFRVANRIGLAKAKNPLQTEKQLMKVLPKEKWRDCHHYIIFYGRQVCTAKNPKCSECEINAYCDYYNLTNKK